MVTTSTTTLGEIAYFSATNTYIKKSGNDLVFKDPNNGSELTLSSLAGASFTGDLNGTSLGYLTDSVGDLGIRAVAGANVVLKLGNTNNSTVLSITDSADAQVAYISDDGHMSANRLALSESAAATITFTNGGTLASAGDGNVVLYTPGAGNIRFIPTSGNVTVEAGELQISGALTANTSTKAVTTKGGTFTVRNTGDTADVFSMTPDGVATLTLGTNANPGFVITGAIPNDTNNVGAPWSALYTIAGTAGRKTMHRHIITGSYTGSQWVTGLECANDSTGSTGAGVAEYGGGGGGCGGVSGSGTGGAGGSSLYGGAGGGGGPYGNTIGSSGGTFSSYATGGGASAGSPAGATGGAGTSTTATTDSSHGGQGGGGGGPGGGNGGNGASGGAGGFPGGGGGGGGGAGENAVSRAGGASGVGGGGLVVVLSW